MTSSTAWDKTVADKRAARDALIPKEWLVQVADDVVDVTDIPAKSGVLSAAELEITETEATDLVKKMVNKELTSEAVTVAFCKRAAIAQQVVSRELECAALLTTDQLPHRDLLRAGYRRCQEDRRDLCPDWQARWAPPRPSRLTQGQLQRQGPGHHRRLYCMVQRAGQD